MCSSNYNAYTLHQGGVSHPYEDYYDTWTATAEYIPNSEQCNLE